MGAMVGPLGLGHQRRWESSPKKDEILLPSDRNPTHPMQVTYNQHTEAISDRNNELHRISELLSEMKLQMEERGTNISDATPGESREWFGAWLRSGGALLHSIRVELFSWWRQGLV